MATVEPMTPEQKKADMRIFADTMKAAGKSWEEVAYMLSEKIWVMQREENALAAELDRRDTECPECNKRTFEPKEQQQ